MSCRFCDMASSRDHSLRGGTDKVILESQDYYAVSSIGGFVSGWVLVCSKQHKLNLKNSYSSAAFWDFSARVFDLVTAEYGPSVIFEHGPNVEGSGTACGSNHAHMHIVPFVGSLESLALAKDKQMKWMACRVGDISSRALDSEYLFCADQFDRENTMGYLALLERPTSQFFRRVLADAVGLTDFFDYKVNRFEEISATTAHRLSQTSQALA